MLYSRLWVISLIISLFTISSAHLFPALALVQPGSAVVRGVNGAATHMGSDGIKHVVLNGTTVKAGDIIETGAGSSIDLWLEQTEAAVGLTSNSFLKLDRLSYEDTDGGRITQTLLDLQAGEMLGKVSKQLAGSKFEVNTPKNVSAIRGTEFYVNALTGDVSVVQGTVQVTVKLKTSPSTFLTRTFTVTAGKTLSIPVNLTVTQFNTLSFTMNSTLSKKQLEFLAEHGNIYKEYEGKKKVTETYTATLLGGGNILVIKPPISIAVSP